MLPTVGLEWSPATQQNPYSHWLFPQPGPPALGPLLWENNPGQASSPVLSVSSVLDCDPGVKCTWFTSVSGHCAKVKVSSLLCTPLNYGYSPPPSLKGFSFLSVSWASPPPPCRLGPACPL